MMHAPILQARQSQQLWPEVVSVVEFTDQQKLNHTFCQFIFGRHYPIFKISKQNIIRNLSNKMTLMKIQTNELQLLRSLQKHTSYKVRQYNPTFLTHFRTSYRAFLYSEVPNRRACSLGFFRCSFHLARNFSCNKQKIPPCSFTNLLSK